MAIKKWMKMMESFPHGKKTLLEKEKLLVISNLSFLLPKRQIKDCSKLKESADDNLKLDENDRKLSKWLENTIGKGEIAHYEQFLLFPSVSKRLILQTHKN